MERKLKALFDFQKFEGNAALQSVIDAVHARSAMNELSEDDLSYVNAAGSVNMGKTSVNLQKPVKL